MAKIHELSANLTNQIAAGEVIERPASVVKELVENSIDAGSSRIRIDFRDAGLKQVVVQDNGTGIERNQIDLAFTRHATSKINNEHDLFRVSTLGFRGEALASIAAVAHVEIVTSTGAIGTKANFSGGTKTNQEDAAARKGTKITVQDLFFNTPARLKYLRSPRTETMRIVDIVNRLALGYPQIAFTLTNAGKVLLRTAGNGDLRQTVANVYGRHIAEKMLPFKNHNQDFTVSGLLSKPELTRSTRNFISILLNGRYIHNFKLNNAIMAGYGNKLSARHYPVAIVAIKVDPFLVDVNVHPTKQEVRLSKEKELGRLITSAVTSTLIMHSEGDNAFANLTSNRQASLVDQLEFNLNKNVVSTAREADDIPEVHDVRTAAAEQKSKAAKGQYVDLSIPRHDKHYLITSTWVSNIAKQVQLTPFNDGSNAGSIISRGDETLANNLPALEYVGQTESYLLAQEAGNLYLLDQVAARRRLAFEKIKKALLAKKIVEQGLLTPIVLEFGNLDFMQIKAKKEQIKKLGIYLDDFGQNSFIIRSYPTWIKGDVENSLRQILDAFLNLDQNQPQKLFAQIAALQAKKEVSGRVKLSPVEGREILAELRKSSDPYHDADGNLILVRMSKTQLQKMFKKDK